MKNKYIERSSGGPKIGVCFFAPIIAFISFVILISTSGCGNSHAAPGIMMTSPQESLIVLGFDQSQSIAGYRKQDTTFVAEVCRSVSFTGGLVVAYGIGEPNDESGLRCYLKKLPEMDKTLVLSKQAELKQEINALSASNKRQISDFLKNVQTHILGPSIDLNRKVKNTDINGFFKKVDVLLNEPGSLRMNQYVFVYSDGIQSLNGKDSPCHHEFNSMSRPTICLDGWKTKPPCDSCEIKYFEDPEGFLQYIRSNSSLNH